ncbi:pyridoxal-phosphate-dependent aminotransferase family protein [Pseudoduganella aquatica]|uniref:Aminotransferase class V-fold PLP-dependent enzyme n=1 Tax=Pseudoduganella aquatica TaxID=2660641 RepID=A0A7X4HAI7_9BURK|nr:alanine--glyoxylate aminotransferase family protein [Pseudoduganella aquatica]MYN06695.1 aminotransferase class V-fold PLP-dependent enzyme [Pseudoduganella aquatica]
MFSPPTVDSINSLLPSEPLLMMGAGPVPIPHSVAQANSIVINHLGGTMAKIIHQMKEMARYVFQTESRWILGVAGPGSAAMEMSVCNLVFPGTRVLSVCNGYFGRRFAEMATRVGGQVECLNVPDGEAAQVAAVREHLERFRPEVLTIAQGETSSTVFNIHLPQITRLAREYGCYVIVDAVCTLSTMPCEMDNWKIDAVVTGGQKGLSSIPGVSLIAFSERAWERINARPVQPPHWCLDAKLAEQFWHNASYHYTAPVSGILALHEALHLICQETLEQRFARHLRCSLGLQRGVEAMGLRLYGQPESRLNSVVGIVVPEGINRAEICEQISLKYRVEISGSFGLNIVRIGQMGEQCRAHHLFRTLHALGSTMKDLGADVDVAAGVAALERQLQGAL